jgi:hypothetical protein
MRYRDSSENGKVSYYNSRGSRQIKQVGWLERSLLVCAPMPNGKFVRRSEFSPPLKKQHKFKEM